MEFKDNLKQLRLQFGYTQEQLGKLLHYGSSTISNYESGHNEPSFSNLIQISKIFSVSTDFLLGIEENAQVYFTFQEQYDKLTELQKQEFQDFLAFLAQQHH